MAVEHPRSKRWYQYSTTADLLYDREVESIVVDKNVQTYGPTRLALSFQNATSAIFHGLLVWASRAVVE